VSQTLVESFGIAVRRLREANGWSQEQLAERAELNRSYVGEIERGQAISSIVTVDKLARALGVTSAKLLQKSDQVSQQRTVRGIVLAAIAC